MSEPTTVLPTTRAVCDELLAGPVPRVVGIAESPHGWELVEDPALPLLDDLFGHRVPLAWWGVGLATTGRARSELDPTAASWPVRIGLVVGRDGSTTSSLLGPDGVLHTGPDDGAPIGLVVDLARRSLGLPTEPEPGHPAREVMAGWGFEVLDAAVATANVELFDDGPVIDELWPVPGLPVGDCPSTWAELHEALVEGSAGWGELTVAEVAWFDAGSFARYVQAHQPSVEEVLTAVRLARVTLRPDVVHPGDISLADSVRAESGEVG